MWTKIVKSLHFTSMQKNQENIWFEAQIIHKSAQKYFCCKYIFQGLQKYQTLKFDFQINFSPWNLNYKNSK